MAPAEPFSCPVTATDDQAVVAPAGDLDALTAEAFRDAVTGALLLPRATRVEVDLSDLTFIDSTGLREVLDATRLAKAREIDFLLTKARPHVQKTFVLVGLEQHLQLEPG